MVLKINQFQENINPNFFSKNPPFHTILRKFGLKSILVKGETTNGP